MIIDSLYAGNAFGIGHGQWTNPIITIPIDTESFTNAYYLGWVRFENIPTIWKTSVYYFDGTAGKLSFNDISVRQNVSIGFAGKSSQGAAPTYGSNYRYLADTGYSGYSNRWGNTWGQGTDSPSDGYGNRLLNKWMPLSTSYRNLNFTLYCLYSGWRNLSYGDRCVTPVMSIADFISFMNGDTSLTFTFASGLSYTLTGTDFTDGYYLDEANNRKIIIASYEFYTNLFYNPDNDLESNLFSGVFGQSDYFYNDEKTECITTGTVVQKTWLSAEYHEMFGFRYFGNIGSSWTICADKTRGINTSTLVQQGTPFGGLITGEISQTQMNDITTYGQYIEMENNNYLIYGYETSGTNFKIVHGYTPTEIYKHAALFRWTPNAKQYGYEDGVVYFPKIDLQTNEFLCELITGTKAEVEPQLPLWFKRNDPTLSEYDDDQKPEYEPPGDDGTDSGGDEIRPTDWTNIRIGAANNFVTLYGMTGATVADFGKKMWASLADEAFWQMVGTAFTNDFSINPADMMKYFISLRYFPFDLADFAHTTATGVYIGRAATPIAPSTRVAYPIRITNNVIQVDGGRLTVRRFYNDFRDYEPCTTVQIHVPFCGSVDVPASEVMGHEMDLTYKIDLQTGAMLAVLGVASNTYYVLATLAGTCGASIPITANNNIEFLQRIATVGSGLIGGGVSGAVKGATVGGEVGAVVGAVAGTVGGGVGALAGLPPVTVHKQGNASGFANLGGVPYAYATVQRGRFELPANYGHTTGFACDFSATLGSLSGFTVCDNVDTSGLTCNARERDEIKRLLESGIYV